MKKILSLVFSIIFILTSVQCIFAEEETEIYGLHDNLSRLFMENCFTEMEIEEMNEVFMQSEMERFRNVVIPSRKVLNRMKTNSEEEELALAVQEMQLNYDIAIRVSCLTTRKYAVQYAEQGAFSYLFSNAEYWAVPDNTYGARAEFTIDGRYINGINEEIGISDGIFVVDSDEIEFIRDENNLKKLLTNKNETVVTDMKIFTFAGAHPLTLLYIKCAENEYFLHLFNSLSNKNLSQATELKQIYDVNYILPIISSDKWIYVSSVKPTYEAEAEALQSEGLLYGNENGLDLLKPMTRMEAVTMILRAIGNNDTAAASTFADVPVWHWGYNAANVAYKLGITSGVSENEFAPERTVTAEEFSAMLLRLTDIGEFDWQNSVNILIENGIISSDDASTMDLFTRGDMAKIIYEIRANGLLQT